MNWRPKSKRDLQVMPYEQMLQLLTKVASSVDMQFEDLKVKTRKRKYVELRFLVVVACDRSGFYVPDTWLSSLFGLDHTCILNARKSAGDLMDIKDERFMEKWGKVEHALRVKVEEVEYA